MQFAFRSILSLALCTLFASTTLGQVITLEFHAQGTTNEAGDSPRDASEPEHTNASSSWNGFFLAPVAWFAPAEETANCQCTNCSCEDCQCSGEGTCSCEGCSSECQCENCSCEDCQCSGDTCQCDGCSESCQRNCGACESSTCESADRCECPFACESGSCESGCECPFACESASSCSEGECTAGRCQAACEGQCQARCRARCQATCEDQCEARCSSCPTECDCSCDCSAGDCPCCDFACPFSNAFFGFCGPCTQGACTTECCDDVAACDNGHCDSDSACWCGAPPTAPRATAEVCDTGAPVVAPLPPEIRDLAQTREDLRRFGIDPFAGSCFDQQGGGAMQFSQLAAQHAERVASAQARQHALPCPPCPVPGTWHHAAPPQVAAPHPNFQPPGPRLAMLPSGPAVPYATAGVAPTSYQVPDTSAHLRDISRQLEQQAATLEDAADYGRADELRNLAEEVRHQARMLRAEQGSH